MTDTDLQQRLTDTVATIDAPPDLVERVRLGGARRLRRRRAGAVATIVLTTAVIGGVATVGQDLLSTSGGFDASTQTKQNEDPYGFLLNRPTRGDLANDQAYLDGVLKIWNASHQKSANAGRGIFDDLRATPHVAWAGTTPGGRAAIVVQQSYLRKHTDIQLNHEGLYTLIGFIGDDGAGRPHLVADSYPAPGVGVIEGFVTGSKIKALVVLDTGKKMGWAAGRKYSEDGSSGREYSPLSFKDGVASVKLPAGTDPASLWIRALPVGGPSESQLVGVPATYENMPDPRMWQQAGSWPLEPGADGSAAAVLFRNTIDKVADPETSAMYFSLWHAYGKTPNGSTVVVGETALDTDPTHMYAVVKTAGGAIEVIPGGVPDRAAALPVAIRLPDGQGWTAVRQGAQLSYRIDGGAWSEPRQNAVLVPDGRNAEVRVKVGDEEKVVPLS